MKILVTGGTGNVGRTVIAELAKRGANVRVLARKQPEDGKLPDGVEVAIGDLIDPVSVQEAMDGVDKLYLLNAVVPEELTHGLIAYDLAKRLKLKHVVYHSVFAVDRFKDVPHFASKLAIETALREAVGLISGPTGAAAKLGVPRQTLESKIRKLGINRHHFKTS